MAHKAIRSSSDSQNPEYRPPLDISALAFEELNDTPAYGLTPAAEKELKLVRQQAMAAHLIKQLQRNPSDAAYLVELIEKAGNARTAWLDDRGYGPGEYHDQCAGMFYLLDSLMSEA
jgi:hypothetical protein